VGRAAIEVLTSAIAGSKEPTPEARRLVDSSHEVLYVLGMTAGDPDFAELTEPRLDERGHSEAIARIMYHAERGVDSLQAAMGGWWTRRIYLFSFAASIVVLGLVATDGSARRLVRPVGADTATHSSTPLFLLTVVAILAALVTPYTSRLLERAGRAS
jgi:hypothetical protein